jgi:GTP:adenosylcobinamide-phosphate guanylyltransferase
VKAVVLAGQPNSGALGAVADAPWEALVPVLGRPMVEYVVDALLEARAVDTVVVVGPAAPRPRVAVVPPVGGAWDNLAAGAAMAGPGRLLVATADIPLLTPAAVDALVAASPPEAEVVYPVVPRSVCEARIPGTRRTYVRLREGWFTGGNLFVLDPASLHRVRAVAERLIAHRKSPWMLARDVGAGLIWRYALGRLRLADIEQRMARRFGVKGKALIFPYAEVGVDVDKPGDLRVAERLLMAPAKG